MSDTVIQVNNLSKRYRIGLKEKRHETLTGQIGSILRAPINNFKRLRSLSHFGEEDESVFWALRDINFEVKQGDVLGIIGHNGAGKSTLLKILSRITEPSAGEVRVKGRISALLEVGTGFHPELTGRENIYMNGTILGMTRREIDRKLDEIIDFSGVEKYVDTAVKFYSSGMKVRLGFAVAAHLEPEILIIDEVLAVGDAEFQRKCLGKMEDVAAHGRTVLFVSHNLPSVVRLCKNATLLEQGAIINSGPSAVVVKEYQKLHSELNGYFEWPISILGLIIQPIYIATKDSNGQFTHNFDASQNIYIHFKYKILVDNAYFTHGLNVFNEEDVNVFNSHDINRDTRKLRRKAGEIFETICEIPKNFMNEGVFQISIALLSQETSTVFFHEKNIINFEIIDRISGESARGEYVGEFPGVVRPLLKWHTKKIE